MLDSTQIVVSLIVAVFGSTGLFTFIQYLITRKDSKDQKLDDLKEAIEDIKSDISKLHDEVDSLKNSTNEDIETIKDNIDKCSAIQARVRILKANDDLRQDRRHSYEYFRQLHQDITDYEQYCHDHPEFENNEAVNSIAFINKVYQECLDTNNFLT